MIAVDKPAGQLVIPGRPSRLGVASGNAPGRAQSGTGVPGGDEPVNAELERTLGRKVFVVHRIDREASGLVVFAKDPETHRELSLLFERRMVKKTYLAAVLGWLDRDGAISHPIREFGSGRMGTGRGGRKALTRYRVLERLRRSSLLAIEPETGRRHQIRVHLYSRGHPILGDPLYGDPRPVGGVARLMLHAAGLAIPRPDGSVTALKCPPPPDFTAVVESLRVKAPG